MTRRTSHDSDTGFSLRHFSMPMLMPTAGFAIHKVFHSQPAATNIAGMGHGALMSAGFCYLCL